MSSLSHFSNNCLRPCKRTGLHNSNDSYLKKEMIDKEECSDKIILTCLIVPGLREYRNTEVRGCFVRQVWAPVGTSELLQEFVRSLKKIIEVTSEVNKI